MTEYVVKIGFWLRAFDSVTVEADADAEAIEKAKSPRRAAMTLDRIPSMSTSTSDARASSPLSTGVAPDGREACRRGCRVRRRPHPCRKARSPVAADEAGPAAAASSSPTACPVHVEVEDGRFPRVTVIDETPVADPHWR